MSDRFNSCAVCDGRIDAYGRDGTRCKQCTDPCPTCDGDVAYCSHPLPKLAVAPLSELNPVGSGAWFA